MASRVSTTLSWRAACAAFGTGKTIEDFACGELGTLRAALTAAEMNAVLAYRRRKHLESSAAFDGVKAARRDPEGWEDWVVVQFED